MDYIIGVDGGGTKTESIAYDLTGNELAKTIEGYGNPVYGIEQAVANIMLSIEGCISKVGEKGLRKVYLGLAGIEAGNNGKKISEQVQKRFRVQAEALNDGEFALKAILKGEDGILTIAGTGSIAFGIYGDRKARSGGWGYLIRDEGSGYKISMEAIRRIAYEDDCGLELSMLSRTILESLGLKKPEDIIEFVYSSDKNAIAPLAPIASSLAEIGEKNAIAILQREGIELAKTTETVYKKLGIEGSCTIGIKGSVIQKSKVLRKAFEGYLKENINGITFVDADISSTKGAYYMYIRECDKMGELV